MSRPRSYGSDAERQKAYRDRKREREAAAAVAPPPRAKRRANVANGKTNAKRARELREEKHASDYVQLTRLKTEIAKLSSVLEVFDEFDIESYGIEDEIDLSQVTDLHDDLLSLSEWLDRALGSVQRKLSDYTLLTKIEKLENTAGRTPEEAQTALRLAKRLRRKLEALLET